MANWTICEHSVNRFLNCSRVVVGQEGGRLRLPNEGWPNLKPTANVLSGLILQLPYTPHTCKMAAFNDNFAIFLKKASNERLRSVRGARGAPSRFYYSVDSTAQYILLASQPHRLLHRPQTPNTLPSGNSIVNISQRRSNPRLFSRHSPRLVVTCSTNYTSGLSR